MGVIDLNMATRGRKIEDLSNAFIVIAEYNRSVQGTGRASYLTAVTEVENELIEIPDVEKILNEISPLNAEVSSEVAEGLTTEGQENKIIFIADDSAVARNQVKKALTSLGLEIEL